MNPTLYMTPSELKVHEATLAAAAAGDDPYGDANESVLDKETLDELAADQARITAPPPAPETDEARGARELAETQAAADKLAAEQAAAAPVETPAAPTPPAPAVVDVPVGKDGPVDLSDLTHLRLAPLPEVDEASYLKVRDETQAAIDAIDSQWEDGTITPEQRREQSKPLRAALDKAQVDHSAAIGEYNATARMNHQQTLAVIDRIKAAGVRDGLDYTQPAKAAQYDAATAAISRDPANANIGWVRVSQLADLAVRAMNGITVKTAAAPVAATPVAAAPAPKAAPTPAPREPAEKPPVTLRDLPVAARAAEQSQTVSARLANADANQRDAIYRTMTPAQRAALLDD